MSFKPTLAVNADFSKIQYPVYASPKLDGIRCSIVDGKALSRTLKAIPNRHIANLLSNEHYDGLDGELIVGSPTSTTCYNETVSNVMAFDKVPDFSYYVFDLHNTEWNYSQRLTALKNKVPQCYDAANIVVLEQNLLINEDEMLAYEAAKVEEGYEGIILRSPEAPYKFGRSTVKEGYLLKVKRFVDQDAEIIGIVEEMYNGNEAQTNELGRTKRSTAASGLSGKGTMGALHVRDLESGVDFHIGTGFTAEVRASMWASPPIGQLCKYKHFPVGQKDKPRHPVFLGLRSKLDI
jgi:DNA ligase-1